MGQTSSGDRVTPEWAEVQRQALNFKELAFLTYESFTASIKQLNCISKTFTDSNGKRLVFVVKAGTDSTLLWKATVKVGCIRMDVETEKIVSYRLLNLKQYMQVYRLVVCQVGTEEKCSRQTTEESETTTAETEDCGASSQFDASCDEECEKKKNNKPHLGSLESTTFTTSMILEKVDQSLPLDECCICMERKPELILPCAHSYCVPCIEQWNVSSKTCPVCRETLESTDDSWVISEAPDSSEVQDELRKLLSGLAKDDY